MSIQNVFVALVFLLPIGAFAIAEEKSDEKQPTALLEELNGATEVSITAYDAKKKLKTTKLNKLQQEGLAKLITPLRIHVLSSKRDSVATIEGKNSKDESFRWSLLSVSPGKLSVAVGKDTWGILSEEEFFRLLVSEKE